MKKLMLTIAFAMLSANVFADDMPALNFTCNLSDLTKTPDPNVYNQDLSLKPTDRIQLASYLGHTYEIWTHDWSDSSPTPREQLSLVALDAASKKVIADASVDYQVEIPEIMLEDGGNIILHCQPR